MIEMVKIGIHILFAIPIGVMLIDIIGLLFHPKDNTNAKIIICTVGMGIILMLSVLSDQNNFGFFKFIGCEIALTVFIFFFAILFHSYWDTIEWNILKRSSFTRSPTSYQSKSNLVAVFGFVIFMLFLICCSVFLFNRITTYDKPEKTSNSQSRAVGELDVVELMTYCEQAIQKQLKDPSSLNISWLSRKIKNISGLQSISFEFTATNSFGGRIKNNAECGFKNGELIFANIGPDI